MTSPRHSATIASAGSGKTQRIIDRALAAAAEGQRVLITTYTIENKNQIERRISGAVDILTWYRFVINELCHPYQLSLLGEIGVVGSLNFGGEPFKYARKTERRFYLDRNNDVYRNRASALALACNDSSGGAVINRLASIYSTVFIDEMQDLAGHDFYLLDVLLRSDIEMHLVGDPRQALYFTDDSINNKRYKGPEFVSWLKERPDLCDLEWLTTSHRCCQAILDWADQLFPEYEPSISLHTTEARDTDGVFTLPKSKVLAYVAERPDVTILRQQKNTHTLGLPAINVGVSKGCTYSHVVLFGSGPMRDYAEGKLALESLKQRSRLYVAVTRARYSVAIVV
jgi:DNA helicase II / ATP-dependent DNA helicase PcrA